MDSPYDSDASEGMRELVERGYAIKRGGEYSCQERGYIGETRVPVRNLDVSHVQHPLASKVPASVSSTHGLTPATQEPVTAAGRNSLHYCTVYRC